MAFVRTHLTDGERTTTTDTLSFDVTMPAGGGTLVICVFSENASGNILLDSADVAGTPFTIPGGNLVKEQIESGAPLFLEMRYLHGVTAGLKTINTSVSGAARYGVMPFCDTGIEPIAPEATATPAGTNTDVANLSLSVTPATDNAIVSGFFAESTGVTHTAGAGTLAATQVVSSNCAGSLIQAFGLAGVAKTLTVNFSSNPSRSAGIGWAWKVKQSLLVPAPIAPFRHLLTR